MHFARTRAAYECDETACGCPPHDRVVNHNDFLPLEHLAHRIVLDLHFRVAASLRRLNERAANVVIANQRELVRQSALLREAERCRV